jgi:hypothetical protein
MTDRDALAAESSSVTTLLEPDLAVRSRLLTSSSVRWKERVSNPRTRVHTFFDTVWQLTCWPKERLSEKSVKYSDTGARTRRQSTQRLNSRL